MPQDISDTPVRLRWYEQKNGGDGLTPITTYV